MRGGVEMEEEGKEEAWAVWHFDRQLLYCSFRQLT